MKHIIFTFLFLFVLAGCGGQVKPDDGESGNNTGSAAEGSGAQVGSVQGAESKQSTVLVDGMERTVSYDKAAVNDSANVLAERIVYFDFDKSDIKSDFEEILKHHGKYLALNSTVTLRIEGHADERGTREYNVALADRRAQAVKRLLTYQGASRNQITVISYGEEKPAALGHDESAWRLNRRAELIYGE